MTANFEIKEINLEQLPEILNIHTISFRGFFLTSLGNKFLATYYSSCLMQKSTIAVGLFDSSDKLYGFAIGASLSKGYHKKVLLENFGSFISTLLGLILIRPHILFRLLKNINKKPKLNDKGDYAELLSIALLPNLKGSGYGKKLLLNFENRAKHIGAFRIALTTDFYNNQSVISFYNKCGYGIYYDFISYPQRRMYKMIKKLE